MKMRGRLLDKGGSPLTDWIEMHEDKQSDGWHFASDEVSGAVHTPGEAVTIEVQRLIPINTNALTKDSSVKLDYKVAAVTQDELERLKFVREFMEEHTLPFLRGRYEE